MTANIILDIRSSTKKGHPIVVAINHNGTRYVSLRKYSKIQHFSNGNVTKKHPDYRTLAPYIRKRAVELEKEVDFCSLKKLPLVKCVEVIRKGIPESGTAPILLSDFWEEILEEYEIEGKSVDMHKQSKKHFETIFGKKLTLDEIDYSLLKLFIKEKIKNGCGRAGTSTYLSKLRTVYNQAILRELVKPSGSPFKGLITNIRSKKIIQISKDDFKKLDSYIPKKGTSPEHAKAMLRRIAVFKFQVLIGGHDLIEIARLENKDIKNGRVNFFRGKMKNRNGNLVSNNLVDGALEIIDRYGTKGSRVFKFIPNPKTQKKSYDKYLGNTNIDLKKISEDLDFPRLSSKSPRYIFRRWAGQARADIALTEQIQGHSLKATTFLYLGRLPDEMVDEELKKILTQ